jgi:hypothetical protein
MLTRNSYKILQKKKNQKQCQQEEISLNKSPEQRNIVFYSNTNFNTDILRDNNLFEK